MLLIAEILLTIAVWRKGWRGWALLPMAIVLGLAFIIGSVAGAGGASEETLLAVGLILDFAGIAALIMMTARAPKRVKEDRHAERPTVPVTAAGQN